MKTKIKTFPKQNLSFPLNEKQKKIFLLMFTRELIRNSGEKLFRLKKISQEKRQIQKTNIKNLVKKELYNEKIDQKKTLKPTKRSTSRFRQRPQLRVPILRIPQQRLPPQFQYLKPAITEKEIDLGELNPYINNSEIQEIEVQGPNQNVYIGGTMGRQPTSLVLNENKIKETISRFSKASKIPAFGGIFKVVVGKLIFSAVISKEQGSRFVIRKMSEKPPRRF